MQVCSRRCVHLSASELLVLLLWGDYINGRWQDFWRVDLHQGKHCRQFDLFFQLLREMGGINAPNGDCHSDEWLQGMLSVCIEKLQLHEQHRSASQKQLRPAWRYQWCFCPWNGLGAEGYGWTSSIGESVNGVEERIGNLSWFARHCPHLLWANNLYATDNLVEWVFRAIMLLPWHALFETGLHS